MVSMIARTFAMFLLLLPLGAGAARLTGRIVDSQEERVFADAVVLAGQAGAVRSDGAGFFRVDALPPGPVLVSVLLADGRRFSARLLIPREPALFVELDRARHVPPSDEDGY